MSDQEVGAERPVVTFRVVKDGLMEGIGLRGVEWRFSEPVQVRKGERYLFDIETAELKRDGMPVATGVLTLEEG
jgi:hypothetical protein